MHEVGEAVGTHAFGEGQHLVQRGLHLGAEGRSAQRGAQGTVQHGATLGGVDGLAAQHGVAPRQHAGLRSQSQQGVARRRVPQVLRQVDA